MSSERVPDDLSKLVLSRPIVVWVEVNFSPPVQVGHVEGDSQIFTREDTAISHHQIWSTEAVPYRELIEDAGAVLSNVSDDEVGTVQFTDHLIHDFAGLF